MRSPAFAPPAFALLVVLLLSGCTLPFGPDGGSVGSAAKALLDPREHAKLLVEVDYPAGYGMNAEARTVLRDTLVELSGRPASAIEFLEEPEIPVEAGKKYTLQEIVALEEQHRDHRTSRDRAVLYVAYVAGGYSEDSGDSRVLGVAYRGTSIAIMKGNIKDASRPSGVGGILQPTAEERCIERAVLTHEFGHAAGLVNLGTPMVTPHEDPQHQGHSSNRESVMYYAVENTLDLFALFTGGCPSIPYQFDANDKADLRALRDS